MSGYDTQLDENDLAGIPDVNSCGLFETYVLNKIMLTVINISFYL